MDNSIIKTIVRIAKILHVSPGKLFINDQGIIARQTQNSNVTGFSPIINQLLKESSSIYAKNSLKTHEVAAQIQQWIDYSYMFIEQGKANKHVKDHVLEQLTNYLETRSYFVGHGLTLADIVVFYTIHSIMNQLSFTEVPLNLGRWYNHLQNNDSIRQDIKLINMNMIMFASN